MILSLYQISKVAVSLGVELEDARIILCAAQAELNGKPLELDGDPIRLSNKTRQKLREVAPELF